MLGGIARAPTRAADTPTAPVAAACPAPTPPANPTAGIGRLVDRPTGGSEPTLKGSYWDPAPTGGGGGPAAPLPPAATVAPVEPVVSIFAPGSPLGGALESAVRSDPLEAPVPEPPPVRVADKATLEFVMDGDRPVRIGHGGDRGSSVYSVRCRTRRLAFKQCWVGPSERAFCAAAQARAYGPKAQGAVVVPDAAAAAAAKIITGVVHPECLVTTDSFKATTAAGLPLDLAPPPQTAPRGAVSAAAVKGPHGEPFCGILMPKFDFTLAKLLSFAARRQTEISVMVRENERQRLASRAASGAASVASRAAAPAAVSGGIASAVGPQQHLAQPAAPPTVAGTSTQPQPAQGPLEQALPAGGFPQSPVGNAAPPGKPTPSKTPAAIAAPLPAAGSPAADPPAFGVAPLRETASTESICGDSLPRAAADAAAIGLVAPAFGVQLPTAEHLLALGHGPITEGAGCGAGAGGSAPASTGGSFPAASGRLLDAAGLPSIPPFPVSAPAGSVGLFGAPAVPASAAVAGFSGSTRNHTPSGPASGAQAGPVPPATLGAALATSSAAPAAPGAVPPSSEASGLAWPAARDPAAPPVAWGSLTGGSCLVPEPAGCGPDGGLGLAVASDGAGGGEPGLLDEEPVFNSRPRFAPMEDASVVVCVLRQLVEGLAAMRTMPHDHHFPADTKRAAAAASCLSPVPAGGPGGPGASSASAEASTDGATRSFAGFAHHDVRMDNVLVNRDGTVALCDFELVGHLVGEDADCITKAPKSVTGLRLLPGAYHPPEGPNSAKGDSWLLGHLAVEAFTGVVPLINHAAAIDDFSEGPLLHVDPETGLDFRHIREHCRDVLRAWPTVPRPGRTNSPLQPAQGGAQSAAASGIPATPVGSGHGPATPASKVPDGPAAAAHGGLSSSPTPGALLAGSKGQAGSFSLTDTTHATGGGARVGSPAANSACSGSAPSAPLPSVTTPLPQSDGAADALPLAVSLLQGPGGFASPTTASVAGAAATRAPADRYVDRPRDRAMLAEQLEDFLSRCLQNDPAQRASVQELLCHPVFSMYQQAIGGVRGEHALKRPLREWLRHWEAHLPAANSATSLAGIGAPVCGTAAGGTPAAPGL